MYSRKSIRAYQPMTRYLPSETDEADVNITPPPDYTGMAFYSRQAANYPAVLSPSEEEERKVSPAPKGESLATAEPALPASEPPAPSNEEWENPPAEEEEPLQADPVAETPPESASTALPPLITPAWLRSLTVEDILLFWMILQLLSGEPEDQIYLLLGLLLFAGR